MESIPAEKKTTGQKPIIDLRNVTKVYRVGSVDVHALRGIDLQIMPGEFCCIIGRSGSGKSTLLNMLAGLEPVTSGEVVINGKHLERMNQSELILFRQKYVGFIFQSFNLMPYYTALENVAFPLSFRGVPYDKRMRLARKALKDVGLESHMNHMPGQMSGGQQQRAGIARAFISRPDIVFADEPTGNLDSKTTREVMEMIRRFSRTFHQTIVLVSHDPEMTEYADRIVTLMDGEIISDVRTPQEAELAAASKQAGNQ